jgi:hypothetical protein
MLKLCLTVERCNDDDLVLALSVSKEVKVAYVVAIHD